MAELEKHIEEAKLRRESKLSPQPFSYTRIFPDDRGREHFRIQDSNDDRVATCYREDNAKLVVELMNKGYAARRKGV